MGTLTTPKASFAASPRKLPTPPPAQRFICHVCRNDSTLDSNISLNSVTLSKFNDFVQFVNKKFNEIELQVDNIGYQISTIVQSIINHKSIISELEREIVDLSDPSPKSLPSSACASTTLSRTAPSSLLSSAPPCRSASPSDPPSLSTYPSPSTPPTRSAPPSPSTPTTRFAHPSLSAPHYRSAAPTRPAHPPALHLPPGLTLPPVLALLPVLPPHPSCPFLPV